MSAAGEAMTAALIGLTERGQIPPCARDPDAWMSESPREREQAAKSCSGCPILQPCTDLATEIRPRFGVYGGRDYSPKPRKAKTS